MTTIYPVIMAGGAGTRLWPVSTSHYPKQFKALLGQRTLFQETVSRVQGGIDDVTFAAPSIIGGIRFGEMIEAQLTEMGVQPHRVVLEPFGRNTAAVAAVAAAIPDDPDALVLLLPSDHFMGDPEAFRRAIADAARHTADGWITTFGIDASHPETGYGYIRRGDVIDGALARCDAFVEKPNLETALQYLADGRYAWNAGIFLFPAKTMADELSAHAPQILETSLKALSSGAAEGSATVLDPDTFDVCPDDSIDYAVMEKTALGAVYGPLQCGWSDIGSWSALADLDPETQKGDVIAIDTQDCYLRSEDGTLIAAVGVSDLVVVSSGRSVLIAPKDRGQEGKAVVASLKSAGRTDKV